MLQHITEGNSKEGVWVYLKWDYNFNFMFALLHIFFLVLGRHFHWTNVNFLKMWPYLHFFLNKFVCCFLLCFMYFLHFIHDLSLLYHNSYCSQHLNIKVCILYITFYIIIWPHIYINRFGCYFKICSN